jgi:hypothetical protein
MRQLAWESNKYGGLLAGHAARVGKQQIWRAASRQARVNARKATQEYRKSNAGNQQRAESEGPIACTGSVA